MIANAKKQVNFKPALPDMSKNNMSMQVMNMRPMNLEPIKESRENVDSSSIASSVMVKESPVKAPMGMRDI